MSTSRCPCLSGETYDACCGRFHRGEADAPTAEALMRSRFSAFAVGDAPYLLRTWHPSTRPEVLDLDPGVRWYRLDIVEAQGGPFDDRGTVTFRAYFRGGASGVGASGVDVSGVGASGVQEETSRFVRVGRAWTYLDGA